MSSYTANTVTTTKLIAYRVSVFDPAAEISAFGWILLQNSKFVTINIFGKTDFAKNGKQNACMRYQGLIQREIDLMVGPPAKILKCSSNAAEIFELTAKKSFATESVEKRTPLMAGVYFCL